MCSRCGAYCGVVFALFCDHAEHVTICMVISVAVLKQRMFFYIRFFM